MGNDLQADLVTRLRGTGLTQASSGVKDLSANVRRLGADAKDFQAKATVAFRRTAAEARDVSGEVKMLGKSLKALGGPLGHFAGQLGKAGAMGGGFRVLALGAVAAGVAMHAYDSIVEANIDSVRKDIEEHRKLADAMEAAGKAQQQRALGAVGSQGADIRRLTANGGQAAIDRANGIAKDKSLGISSGDARAGVASAYLLKKSIREAAIDAATAAARTGSISFPDAINNIAKDRHLQQLLSSENGHLSDPFKVSKRLVIAGRGQDYDKRNDDSAAEALTMSRKGTLLSKEVNKVNAINGQIDERDQQGIEDGEAVGAARGELAHVMQPFMSVLVEQFKKNQQAQEEANRLAAAAGPVMMRMNELLFKMGMKVKGADPFQYSGGGGG